MPFTCALKLNRFSYSSLLLIHGVGWSTVQSLAPNLSRFSIHSSFIRIAAVHFFDRRTPLSTILLLLSDLGARPDAAERRCGDGVVHSCHGGPELTLGWEKKCPFVMLIWTTTLLLALLGVQEIVCRWRILVQVVVQWWLVESFCIDL